MATTQQKRLKTALKEVGATRDGRANISVKTERLRRRDKFGRRFTEYGFAISRVDPLTDEQVQALKVISPYITVRTFHANEKYGWSLVKS